MNAKRKQLLSTSVFDLCIKDNGGDPSCKTCNGHGTIDIGGAYCEMQHCPDCYPDEFPDANFKHTCQDDGHNHCIFCYKQLN